MSHAALFATLKSMTTVTALAVRLSPLPDIWRIHKTQSTENVSVLPFVALFGTNYLWLLYGYLDANYYPVVTASGFGCITSLIYTAVYCAYTQERRYAFKLTAVATFLLALVTVYAFMGSFGVINQSRGQVVDALGYMAVCVNILLYVSPFETVKKIVATKSAASLPIAMCCMLVANCSLWVVCGVVDNDMFMLTPNVIGATLSLVQVLLYVVYNPNRKVRHELEDGDSLASSTRSDSHFSIIASPKDESSFAFGKVGSERQGLVIEPRHSPLAALGISVA